MDLTQIILVIFLIFFFFIALWRILRAPLKLALKLFTNTLLGFLALWLVRFTSSFTGITLGLNFFNAFTIGILGLPGFLLLLLAQWVL